MAFDLFKIKQEIAVFLKNQNILTISERGVSTNTESFSGDGSTTDFDLTPPSGIVRNVRSVTVDSVAKDFGDDYLVDYEDSNPGRVSFTVAPPIGPDNIDVQYDHSTTGNERIYTFWPKPQTSLSKFPRVAVDVLAVDSEELSMNLVGNKSTAKVSITAFAGKEKKVEDILTAVRTALLDNKKSFYYFNEIVPAAISPLIPVPDRKEEVLQRTHDFDILNLIEL